MTKKISQREARRLRRELKELREKHRQITDRFASNFPGTFFWRLPVEQRTKEQFITVARLGFGIAARLESDDLHFYAVKP
jgi:hypothetical protein